ncbi:MAG: hypothetical protein A2X86_13100 [Bdellovibrionales bacterium GWA2_49_15]|nr:MAG: hypothetical protein A2X86_13100 [Bdellovibrionales bacterium GWA2_49_15]HAZ13460.1 hypothetical protein [Bdellovibrionales bacterium]
MRASWICVAILISLVGCTGNKSATVGDNSGTSIRRPASGPNSLLTSQVDEKIKAISSVADVKEVVALTERLAKENPGDKAMQVYRGMIKAFKATEGIVDRLNSGDNGLSQSELVTVGLIRKLNSNLYRIGPHFKPIFDYVFGQTEKNDVKKIKRYSELQNYYISKVYPEVESAIQILNDAVKGDGGDDLNKTIFTFDLALLLGEQKAEKLINPKNRYLEVTTDHIHWVLADLHRFQASMCYWASYNFDGIDSLRKKYVRKYAVRGLVDRLFKTHYTEAILARDFYKEIIKDQYRNLFTMRDSKVKDKYLLVHSRDHSLASVKHRIRAVKGLEISKDFGKENKYIVSPSWLLTLTLANKASLEKRQRLLVATGPQMFNDPFFTQSFELNLAELYNPANASIRDLKRLMPRPENFHRARSKKDRLPLFLYGDAPDSLPDYTMAGIFPKARSLQDLKLAMEILSHDNALPLFSTWMDLFL